MGRGKKLTQEEVIRQCKLIHPEYDYSKTIFSGSNSNMIVTCPTHGDFVTRPSRFIMGAKCGCPKCNTGFIKHLSQNEFIERCKSYFPTYDFSQTIFKGKDQKVRVTCNVGHTWFPRAGDISRGHGCPVCARENRKKSLGEEVIQSYLSSLKIRFIQEYEIECPTNPSNKAYIDFYLPEQNCFIEYNGKQHYTPINYFGGELRYVKQCKRDEYVKKYCEQKGIKLVEIKYNDNITKILSNEFRR